MLAYCCDYCESQCGEHDFTDGICNNCGGYQVCDGSGTVTDPYQINNVDKLLYFATKVNNGKTGICGKLIKSIDLANREWTGIGTADKPFTGTFDGNHKLITGLKIKATGSDHGLFGVVKGGTVKNIEELRGEITIAATATTAVSNVGGAVGQAYGGATIEDVTSYVNISDTGEVANGSNSWLGGVVGFVSYDNTTGSATVANCEYRGTINMTNAQIVGGVVGGFSKKSTITECTNYGTVTAGSDAKHIVGVLGDAKSGTEVTLCVNVGNVTSGGADCIGGVVAYANENCKIENCYNTGRVTCTNASGGYIGGVLGYINNNSFGGLKNCFNYGKIITNSSKANHAGAVVGWLRSSTSMFQNNYWLDTSYTAASGGNAISATAYDKGTFESGLVAWKLNGESSEGVWKQLLGELPDTFPNFIGDNKVYYGYLT